MGAAPDAGSRASAAPAGAGGGATGREPRAPEGRPAVLPGSRCRSWRGARSASAPGHVPSAPGHREARLHQQDLIGCHAHGPSRGREDGCLAARDCGSTWLPEACGRLKGWSDSAPRYGGALQDRTRTGRGYSPSDSGWSRWTSRMRPAKPGGEAGESRVDQPGRDPSADVGRHPFQPRRFHQDEVGGAQPGREPAGEAVGGDVPARRQWRAPARPAARAARPRRRPPRSSASLSARASRGSMPCSASPNCCIARIAMRCATRSSTARAGCSARTASANGPPPGTTIRAGPGRVASSASRGRRAGASCRLPPSLTTHIAASQIGRFGSLAGSPCSIALVKLLGAPAPWLMGVVNVTPDSFSDGGRHLAPDTRRRARPAAAGRRRPHPGPGRRIDRPREPADRRRDGAGAAGAGGARAGSRGRPVDRHLSRRHRGALRRAGRPDRQRRLGPARRPGDGRRRARPGAGPGDDARQGRAPAARHRPPGAAIAISSAMSPTGCSPGSTSPWPPASRPTGSCSIPAGASS